jgi:hypothetical protein
MMALRAYSLFSKKVTLVDGTALDPGMSALEMKRVAFPNVFQSSGLEVTETPDEIPA